MQIKIKWSNKQSRKKLEIFWYTFTQRNFTQYFENSETS